MRRMRQTRNNRVTPRGNDLKEEKTKAIESTAQTALAITAIVLTAGAAAPAVAATTTATTAATTAASFTSTIASAISTGISTVGAVVTGTASVGNYVQVASIALQAAIGSRTGGVEGAMAGAANGVLQAFAGSLGTKEAGALKDKADEIGQQVNAGLMNMDEGVAALEAAKNAAKLANVGAKTLAATNVSYTKEDGWGIKANVTGLLSAVGVTQGGYGGSLLQRLTNVTIGQSQRGGASVNLGFNTPIGNMGINYTGATGTFGGSYDIMERQVGGLNLSSELSYDGEQGLSVSGNADFGNGLGLGAENGRNGATGSLTLLGSTQGTVNEDGVYEANGNFLGEISGQDIIDLHNTIAQQEGNATIEDAARNAPAKSAKDAANSDNSVDDRDNDAQEEAGGQGSEGLVDLVFAGTAVLFSAGAAFLAGGGSGSATPSSPAGGQGGAGNGGNATVARKPEDEKDSKVKGEGGNTDEPPIKPYKVKAGSERVADLLGSGEDLAKHGIKVLFDDNGKYYRLADGTEVRDTHVSSERNLRANQKEANGNNMQNASVNDAVLNSALLSGVVFDQAAREKGIRSPELIAAENYPSDKAEQFKQGIIKLNAQLNDVEGNIKKMKAALTDLENNDKSKNIVSNQLTNEVRQTLTDLEAQQKKLKKTKDAISRLQNSGIDGKDIQFSQRRIDAVESANTITKERGYSQLDEFILRRNNLEPEGYDHIADRDGVERVIYRSNVAESDTLLTRYFAQDVETRIEITPGGTQNTVLQEGRGFLSKLLGDTSSTTIINNVELEDGGLIIRHNDGKLEAVNPLSIWDRVKSSVAGTLKNRGFDVEVPNDPLKDALKKLAAMKKPILWTQNGMDNLGMDAVNMNDAARISSTKSGTEYAASVGVYNASNTFVGDLLKMKFGSIANRLGSAGIERADRTWDRIFESGALNEGGRIIGHSQGAYITTEAIRRNVDPATPPKIELILAGGAQSNQVANRVRNVTNLRNGNDYIPGIANDGAPVTLDWVEDPGSYLDDAVGRIKSVLRGDGTSPETATNGESLGIRWGGDNGYSQYVNGNGHSFLQYMNGIQYWDETKPPSLKEDNPRQSEPVEKVVE
jgi:hypothetical protein